MMSKRSAWLCWIRSSLLLGILAGATPLIAQPKPADPSVRGSPRILQGPMIGAVSPTEVLLWARLSGPFSFSVSCGETTDDADLRPSETVTARAEDDFTVVLRLRELKPDTTYYY